jgi:hypothetical protein
MTGYGLDNPGSISDSARFSLLNFVHTGPGAHPTSYPNGKGKEAGREADHSLPTSAEVKNTWIYTTTPRYVFMA